MAIETAERMFNAIEARDLQTFRSLLTDDFLLWHSFDQVERDPDQVVSDLTMMLSVVKNVRYVDRKFVAIPGGIIAQYVHTGTATTGKPVTLHVMLRCYLQGDRIKRIEEYVDSGECAVILEAAQAAQANSQLSGGR